MNTDIESLLKPVSEEAPAGKPLRGTMTFREIEAALQEDLSGAAQGGVLIKARPEESARLAIKALSTDTKDLFIAVWLTEALLRIDGFDGLRRGLDILRGLISRFWDTVYPLSDDGDEEIRASPLTKLTGKPFARAMEQIAITKDGYTRLDEKILRDIPLKEDVGMDEELARVRRDAEEKKRVLPENFAISQRATGFAFYEKMAADIVAAKESLRALGEECAARFTDPYAVPNFGSLEALFEPYQEMAAELMRQKAPQPAQAPAPPPLPEVPPPPPVSETLPPPPPEPEPPPPSETFRPAAPPSSVSAFAPSPVPVAASLEPDGDGDAARLVFAAARYLRQQDPANPAAFMLLRSWHFGRAIGRGAVDDAEMEPPPADLRKELFRCHRERDWSALLSAAERTMEHPCGAAWLDLQYYAGVALENLGDSYAAAYRTICDSIRQYLASLPGLPRNQLLDGTPAASPQAARWLETLASSAETSWVSPASIPPPFQQVPAAEPASVPIHGDYFADAVQLAQSGRIAEALRVFQEKREPAETGLGRFETRLRVASLCLAAKQPALALPALRDARREIRERNLQDWDPELAARALAMLYGCLLAMSSPKTQDEMAEVFTEICVLDPRLAVKLADKRGDYT